MIFLIKICREKLHIYEFVKPVGNVLVQNQIKTISKNYKSLTKKDLDKASKIIICGTSLKDEEFIDNVGKFSWIKNFNKPILGICGGMQIIQLIFNGELRKKQEIGFYKENFVRDFLGLRKGEHQVYHLHNNYVTLTKDFVQFNKGSLPQAIKHKHKPIYGVLFHPEVRNKNLILNFAKL